MEPSSIVPESSVKASLSGAYSPSWSAFGGVNMDLRRSILTEFVCLLRALGCDGPSSVVELSKTSRYQKTRTRPEQKKGTPAGFISPLRHGLQSRAKNGCGVLSARLYGSSHFCIMYDFPYVLGGRYR